jgi:hypothetical protein
MSSPPPACPICPTPSDSMGISYTIMIPAKLYESLRNDTNRYEILGAGTKGAVEGGARHYRAIFDIGRTKLVNSETSGRQFYDKLWISQIAHGPLRLSVGWTGRNSLARSELTIRRNKYWCSWLPIARFITRIRSQCIPKSIYSHKLTDEN